VAKIGDALECDTVPTFEMARDFGLIDKVIEKRREKPTRPIRSSSGRPEDPTDHHVIDFPTCRSLASVGLLDHHLDFVLLPDLKRGPKKVALFDRL
jgi:hypothetical protein